VALRTVIEMAPQLKSIRLIRFVLWDEEALRIHEETLARLIEEKGEGSSG